MTKKINSFKDLKEILNSLEEEYLNLPIIYFNKSCMEIKLLNSLTIHEEDCYYDVYNNKITNNIKDKDFTYRRIFALGDITLNLE